MKRLIGILPILIFAVPVRAQLWSGIIDPSRAIDWTQAGIPEGIPDANWTQCGPTVAAYSGTSDAITSALAACGTNQYVLLGPGTFNLSTSIDFAGKSNVVLRGSGADKTLLVFSAATNLPSCNTGASQLIGICGNKIDLWSSPTVYQWTAGYAQGTSNITLSGTAGISTVGSGKPTLIVLNQNDDGYTGYPANGSAIDNGNYFVCADAAGAGTGCSYDGPDGMAPSPFTHRWQEEIGLAISIDSASGVVTLSQPLKHPNWRTAQHPTAVLFGPTVVYSGVENLSIDMKANPSISYAINFSGAYKGWVSGVRVMNGYNWAIGGIYSSHLQFQNNYLYSGTGPDPYGFRFMHTADSAIVNNIIQKIRAPLVFDSPDSGSVIAYNFAVNDYYASDAMFPAYWDHSTSNDFHLWEGNIGSGLSIDNSHGTHLDETAFRNFLTGWESCANGQCGSQPTKDFGTAAVAYTGYNRYGNVIGNIVGTPGFTNVYENSDFGGNNTAYYLGVGNPGVTPPLPNDPLTATTLFRWRNYDVVTNAEQTRSAEVPSSLSLYPNSIPTNSSLPPSFFYLTKPSWWRSLPWPPIGPDVNGGNIGQCSGPLNATGKFNGVPATNASQCAGSSLNTGAWAGHVNTNPAMNCYLNTLDGPPDGSGGALAFNADACYGSASAASTSDIYISQNGTGAGTSCADAKSISWLNATDGLGNPTNWGGSAGQVGPGMTIHLCGTISSSLSVLGSGTAGQSITLFFEPNALMSSPVFSAQGAINLSHRSYITIDGGTNGMIQNTANGTALANQLDSTGILGDPVDHVIIKNLTIRQLYQRTLSTDPNRLGYAITLGGSNILVQHNTLSDGDAMISYAYHAGTQSNVTFDANTITRTNHGINIGSYGSPAPYLNNLTISNNRLDDFDPAFADDPSICNPSCPHHIDAIIIFNESTDSSGQSIGAITGMQIFGNNIGPHIGSNNTAALFLDDYVESQFVNARIFNNVFTADPGKSWSNGFIALGAGTDFVISNNTMVGQGTGSGGGISVRKGSNIHVLNNINASDGSKITMVVPSPNSTVDNNIYFGNNYDGFAEYANNQWGIYSGFPAWQASGLGYDLHSAEFDPMLVNPVVSGGDFHLKAGSPAVGFGSNLSSYCSANPAMCVDYDGHARPVTGPWDVGAQEYCPNCPITTPPVAPPTTPPSNPGSGTGSGETRFLSFKNIFNPNKEGLTILVYVNGSDATLNVYDRRGEDVGTIVIPADGRATWDGKSHGQTVASGTYLLVLKQGSKVLKKKVVVVK